MFSKIKLIKCFLLAIVILGLIWGIKTIMTLKNYQNAVPLSVVIDYNGEKLDYRNIRIFRTAPNGGYFEMEKYQIDYWILDKSYFKSVLIAIPDAYLNSLENVRVKIGKNEFDFNKNSFNEKWEQITANSDELKLKKDFNYIFFKIPEGLRYKSSFIPPIKKIINWNGDISLIIKSFPFITSIMLILLVLFLSLNDRKCFIKNSYKFVLKYSFFIGIFVVLLYLSPFIIMGDNVSVKIGDNLNESSYWRTLALTKSLFKYNENIPQIMNGLPRNCLPSALNFQGFLYSFFDHFVAYTINEFIIHFVAFIGAFLLLRTHFLPASKDRIIVLCTALCFSFIPFFNIFSGLSIAGQPLLLYVFLNLYKRQKIIPSFFVAILFPFYSSFYFVGMFIIAGLSGLLLFFWIKDKKINFYFLSGIALLFIFYMVVDFNMLYQAAFNKTFVSHRTLWYLAKPFSETFLRFLQTLAAPEFGNITNYHTPFLFPLSAFIIFTAFNRKEILKKNTDKNNFNIIAVLLILMVSISFYSAIIDFKPIYDLKKKIPVISEMNINRLLWIVPTMWYIVIALFLSIFSRLKYLKKYPPLKFIIPAIFFIQIIFLFSDNVPIKSLIEDSKLWFSPFKETRYNDKRMSYKRYFSKELLTEVGDYIALPKEDYRVVSIGIDPVATQNAGFYTLDSYQNYYSLDYYLQFRDIIGVELDKNPLNKETFDKWGGNCYIYVAEIGVDRYRYQIFEFQNLELNINKLKEMGGKYIISTSIILNEEEKGLKYKNMFENETSLYRIFLYEVL